MVPPNKLKTRFNAKARQSFAGTTHKKRKNVRSKDREGGMGENVEMEANNGTNAIMIDPEEQRKKVEADQKRRELLAKSQDPSIAEGSISSKKRKRLDAFIARQLKKEKRQQLIADLAKSSAEIGDRSTLMSAATLGTGKVRTGQERLDMDLARSNRTQTNGRKGQYTVIQAKSRSDDEDADLDVESGSDHEDQMNVVEEDVKAESEDDERQARIDRARALFAQPTTSTTEKANETGTSIIGSALAAGNDGKPLIPIVRKRRKQKRKPLGRKTAWGRVKADDVDQDSDDVSKNSSESSSEEEDSGSEIDDEVDGDSDEDDDDDEGDDSEEESEEDEDDEEEDEEESEEISKRRGLPSTEKSKGFKEWALSAMNVDGPITKIEDNDDDVYRGPEPVAGLTQRVGDLGDGTIRGPLGEDEPTPKQIGSFAQRYYDELKVWQSKNGKKSDHINIERDETLQESRLKLPVVADEEKIVRTIMENMVTVLCGETGSGKTTQVPQFLFEAGFGSPGTANSGMIGVTQPRRVAALSMAARVGHELGLGKDRVSHQIRYDATVSSATSIKFMTDGVLLRELAIDFMLNKYSAIIIDEAHERSVNTDVLIGVLSRVARLRAKKWIAGEGKPLRLIIMSATLRVEDFAGNERLFDIRPPILQIEARQYPVTVHFSRRTNHDYVEEAIKKACKIHARLPNGGILIFMTGQAEISTVCQRLERRFGKKAIDAKMRAKDKINQRKSFKNEEDKDANVEDKVFISAKDVQVEVEDIDLSTNPLNEEEEERKIALEDGDAAIAAFDDEEALETDDEEEGREYDADLPDELRDDSDTPMHILPLYSLLPSERQMQVFAKPPENTRLVVVATNIAETSLTIPGITYVVDCGRSKERLYDATNGIQSFEVGFISKASADQRAGRAGRTGPGHCYRLYSSNVYEEHFSQFAQPEILRMPVDNLVLMMKSMNIENVTNFPFPTAPDRQAIRRAEKLLFRLGALGSSSNGTGNSSSSASEFKITDLGRSMSLFPLSSRLSKMLVQGNQHGCLPFVIVLVSALSVGDPFIREESLHDPIEGQSTANGEEEMSLESQHLINDDEKEREQRRAKRSAYFKALNRFAVMSGALSDPLRLLSAVGAYEHSGGSIEFCQTNYLTPKTMEEIHKLRSQIANLVQANASITTDLTSLRNPKLEPPSSKQLNVLRQFLTAAFIDQIAIRADLSPEAAARVPMLQQENKEGDQTISQQFIKQTRQGAKMQSTRNVAYLAAGIPSEACFIHKSSILFHQSPPEWIIFSNIVRGQSKGDHLERKGRNWLKGATVINPNWIYKLGSSLCSLSKPIETGQSDSRSKLIQAAQDLKRKATSNTATEMPSSVEKTVYLVPNYGTGPAFDASERNSYIGWDLPPLMAKQRLVKGRWVTELP